MQVPESAPLAETVSKSAVFVSGGSVTPPHSISKGKPFLALAFLKKLLVAFFIVDRDSGRDQD